MSDDTCGATARDVLRVMSLDDDELKAALADALRDSDQTPLWRRRLLAWRLEQPPGRKRTRQPDFDFVGRFLELREQGLSFKEAAAQLAPRSDPRDVRRKVERAEKLLYRRFLEFWAFVRGVVIPIIEGKQPLPPF